MSEQEQWTGRERRKNPDRRQTPDRRDEIRFEPGKQDRRKDRGRRKDEQDPWMKNRDS
ncbi:hypothetical protein [Marinobacterium stanieri]|uniref:hypothetical protein n=1 Tax=Marinobacterium stanieri TaxID=49186 RepID=UPI00031AAA01|nr:hypothetical protein [Marinobacterium stanieri]